MPYFISKLVLCPEVTEETVQNFILQQEKKLLRFDLCDKSQNLILLQSKKQQTHRRRCKMLAVSRKGKNMQWRNNKQNSNLHINSSYKSGDNCFGASIISTASGAYCPRVLSIPKRKLTYAITFVGLGLSGWVFGFWLLDEHIRNECNFRLLLCRFQLCHFRYMIVQ